MDLFKDLIWDVLVKLALQWLFTKIPLLGWGPIGAIVSWVVLMFADDLYDGIKEHIDLQGIAFKREELEREYSKAGVYLKSLELEKGFNSDEYKQAREEFRKRLGDFMFIDVKLRARKGA